MIVPPVTIMPFVPVSSECFVKADAIFFVVQFLAMHVFLRFDFLPLTCWPLSMLCEMGLRIDCRESLIVRIQYVAVTCRWINLAHFSRRCGTGVLTHGR